MTMSMPRWILITHIFNHQTHHRGQAHAMLTAAGAKPADTDIPFLPDVLSFF
ncbi:MAG: DinB family protein [Parvularculaceae bacterium]